MSAVPTALAQLLARPDPVADPATAKLLRAALEALQQHAGETVAAKIVGPLPGGLTQLLAGTETLILKLATPLPAGAAVSLKISTTPDGQPAVSVETQPHTSTAAPAPIPQRTASLLAQASVPAQAAQPGAPQATATSLPAASPVASSAPAAPAAAGPPPAAPSPAAAQPAAPAPAAATTAATLPTATPAPAVPVVAAVETVLPQPLAPQAPPAARAPAAPSPAPQPALTLQQSGTTPPPIPAAGPAPLAANPAVQALAPSLSSAAPAASPPAPQATAAAPAPLPTPTPLSSIPTAYPQPARPQPANAPAPLPISVPAAAQPTIASAAPTVAPSPIAQPAVPATAPPVAAPTLTLTDPAQAAARQQSSAPLLASLSTLAAVATPLPRPVIEAALKVLATRIDLNQAPPTPAALREAVLGAGVLAQPAAVTTDSKLALLQLRSALVAFLGAAPIPAPPAGRRPPPPLRGEDPRAPSPESPPPDDGTPHDAARTLLSHTDGALSRLKLLQLASQPADPRPNPAAPAEYRVEIPMMLGAETGIMQLQIQRDAHNKSQPRARGWRMRFALSFSAIGEVGAEVALLGQSASVALWAADPDTADALEAMLPELAPALAARGLDVTGVRLRRGAPHKPARAPGQLLDSAT